MGPGLMEEKLRPYTGRELQGEEATSGMTASTARQKKSCVYHDVLFLKLSPQNMVVEISTEVICAGTVE